MSEELKGLIEKIHKEGVKAAEGKAKDIEESATCRADSIVEKAEKTAEDIIQETRAEASKMKESGEASLKQAGRNLMISLKKEINAMLEKIVTLNVREALDPATMAKILVSLIKNYKGGDAEKVIVSLSKQDLRKIESDFLAKLKKEIKKGIKLKASDDIRGGFSISYDEDRSHYDFTDKALSEYIGSYLRPKLREILEGPDSAGKKK